MSTDGFFNKLLEDFGIHTHKNVKELSRLPRKLASMNNRKVYLLECKRRGIFPKHIQNNIKSVFCSLLEDHPYVYLIDRIMSKTKVAILNGEIKVTCWKAEKLKRRKSELESLLAGLVSSEVLSICIKENYKSYENIFAKIKSENCRKLQALLITTLPGAVNSNVSNKEKVVFNFSKIQIPDYALKILQLPAKFGVRLANNDFPIPTLIKDLEFGIMKIKPTDLTDDEL